MDNKNFISTFSGIRFNPTEPAVQNIKIEDIAHALSLICRGNGHIRAFYSVAQHSICCAVEAEKRGYSKRIQLLCLLHDASEAYIGDMTRPLKRQIPVFSIFEEKMQSVIFSALDIEEPDEEEQKAVKSIDDAMLYHEFKMMNGHELFEEVPKIHIEISDSFKDFKSVEKEFLGLYNCLSEEEK
ncbi:MAG: phosphohydrolase [Clostridiales bacterium]|nr:phosphohydrolase [Clostridiales bacterium]